MIWKNLFEKIRRFGIIDGFLSCLELAGIKG